MPRYSSAQFYKDWRYSLEKDFTDPAGEQVKYAPDGFRTWGSEIHKLPFPKAPENASVNADCSLIAIAVDDNIYIYDTVNFAEVFVCKGHVSRVDALSFQPGNPKVLVSSAQNNYGGSAPAEPTIIIWDLDKEQENPMMEANVISSIASQATDSVVENFLMAQPRIELSEEEEKSLTSAIEPVISRIVRTHAVSNQRSISGRLSTSFQAELFSPSGSHLIYMPGKRPQSNDVDRWDVKIYSMATHEDVLTLRGHTDALMWMGYSPDETMIATVAWDQSMRIWDAVSGEQKFEFRTSGQNWTGGFSPDSKRFAGMCGDGTFYVYSLSDGAILVTQKTGQSWMRALGWSTDSNTLAVGERNSSKPGRFILFDVDKKKVIQERILSMEACKVPPEYKSWMGGSLECHAIKFVDGGRKVLVLTSGDGGIETYDLETWEKWRFARPHIDPPFDDEPEKEEEEKEEVVEKGKKKLRQVDLNFDNPLTHGGYHMTVWEDHKRGTIFYASMDGDAVRIWNLPMTRDSA
ncbi:WD40 repeat-like protein [Stipitochalara longipes BDJ]|nr:WD40 repeat-like protein [Stipitochalara longipes BDJ]